MMPCPSDNHLSECPSCHKKTYSWRAEFFGTTSVLGECYCSDDTCPESYERRWGYLSGVYDKAWEAYREDIGGKVMSDGDMVAKIPDGSIAQSVVIEGNEIVVYGIPDVAHNCDLNGCPSVGHVLAVMPLKGLVRLSENQELPTPKPINYTGCTERVPAYSEAQQDMISDGFRRVEGW